MPALAADQVSIVPAPERKSSIALIDTWSSGEYFDGGGRAPARSSDAELAVITLKADLATAFALRGTRITLDGAADA